MLDSAPFWPFVRVSCWRRPKALFLVAMIVLFYPAFPLAARAELYRHVGPDGKVTYSNQPGGRAESVDLEREIQVQKPEGGDQAAPGQPSEAVLEARQKRKQIQRWAESENRKAARRKRGGGQRSQTSPWPVSPAYPSAGGPARSNDDARCQRVYGKPCSEIRDWKSRATADCKRRNLSRDCESDDYLRSQRPRTREQQQAIDEKRAKRRLRRERRQKKAVDRIRKFPSGH